jgi:hypothetical protein
MHCVARAACGDQRHTYTHTSLLKGQTRTERYIHISILSRGIPTVCNPCGMHGPSSSFFLLHRNYAPLVHNIRALLCTPRAQRLCKAHTHTHTHTHTPPFLLHSSSCAPICTAPCMDRPCIIIQDHGCLDNANVWVCRGYVLVSNLSFYNDTGNRVATPSGW